MNFPCFFLVAMEDDTFREMSFAYPSLMIFFRGIISASSVKSGEKLS